MSDLSTAKSIVRKLLREKLEHMTDAQRHQQSSLAVSFLTKTPEFQAARVVMIYLSTSHEVDTSSLALKCWQAGKTVVAPKVSWDQKRMLPVEINTLQTGLTSTGPGIREPETGKPCPVGFIDLVIVPGLGFSPSGYRLGRGMGFYDRFLAVPEFIGTSCGLSFQEQLIEEIPVLEHDVPLNMLVSSTGIRRFCPTCIQPT